MTHNGSRAEEERAFKVTQLNERIQRSIKKRRKKS